MNRYSVDSRAVVFMSLLLVFIAWGTPVAAEDPCVTISVINAEVRDVLTTLAEVGGVGIILDDSVFTGNTKDDGRITLQLTSVAVETAIDMITKVKGLAYLRQGDIYIIGTQERITKEFESLRTVKIRYAAAADVKQALELIIPAERIKLDEASNSLIYTGSAAEARRIDQALAAIDVQVKQVTLEAQVMAVNKGAAKELGLEWQWSALPAVKQDSTAGGSNHADTPVRDYPGVIQFGHHPDGLRYEFQFQSALHAMLKEGEVRVLSRPKVTTLDGRQARIMVGDRIPVLIERTENNRTTTTIEYVDAGIKLSYTPRIHADGLITAAVRTEVSTPTLEPVMKAYRITTREAETEVRMKDGETIVIGGLIGSDESKQFSKLPGLGDLPILGALFRSTSKAKNETEVIIMLKAKIVE